MSRALSLVLLLVATAASASAKDATIARGMRLYDEGRFEQARDVLAIRVESPLITSEDRTSGRIYLAASYFALTDGASAKSELLVLARENPSARVDPALFPPELVTLAEEARTELKQETDRAAPLSPPPPPVVVEKAPEPATEHPGWAINLVPFGVGQFAHGDRAKGTFFLVSETAAFGTFAATLTWFEASKRPGSTLFQEGYFDDPVMARHLLNVYRWSFVVGAALAVAGVIDAFLEQPRAGAVALDLGPGGGSLRVVF